MVVNILLCSPRATTEDESSALIPYYFLLAPYCLLLLVENGAKRFRVSTSGLDAFRVPSQWVFVNGAKRRFVFARSAKPLPLGVRWPRQRIGNTESFPQTQNHLYALARHHRARALTANSRF